MTTPTGGPETPPPAGTPGVPDFSDLIGNPGKPPRQSNPSSRLYAGGAIGAIVLLGAGFAIGHFTAPSGPSTLAAALADAQSGKLPCGTPSSSSGAGGAGTFIVARLCNSSGAGGGGTAAGGEGGPGGGFGGGGFGGGGGVAGARGGLGSLVGGGTPVTGTITSLNGTSLTLSTRAGDVTIQLPSSATITKTTAGSLSDLTSGLSVLVGTTTSGSSRTATSIFVLPARTSTQNG